MNEIRTMNARDRVGFILALVCGLFLVTQHALAQENETQQDMEIVLVEIPMPDLTRLKPEIRNLIEPAIAKFEAGRDEFDGAELGLHYAHLAMHFHANQMYNEARAAYRNALLLDAGNYRWTYLIAIVLCLKKSEGLRQSRRKELEKRSKGL